MNEDILVTVLTNSDLKATREELLIMLAEAREDAFQANEERRSLEDAYEYRGQLLDEAKGNVQMLLDEVDSLAAEVNRLEGEENASFWIAPEGTPIDDTAAWTQVGQMGVTDSGLVLWNKSKTPIAPGDKVRVVGNPCWSIGGDTLYFHCDMPETGDFDRRPQVGDEYLVREVDHRGNIGTATRSGWLLHESCLEVVR